MPFYMVEASILVEAVNKADAEEAVRLGEFYPHDVDIEDVYEDLTDRE